MLFRKPKDVNMLEGPIVSRIFQLAVPLMLSNLLQVLYSAADMIVVKQSGVAGAVGAIGTTNTVVNLITNLFIGFSIGANVVIARRIGAKEYDRVREAVHTALLVGLLFGFIGGLLGFLISPTAMVLMGDEGRILDMAVKYCRIRFVATPLMALTNFQIATFRAKGNSTTPLIVLTISGALNVLFNVVFVVGLGMDVDGVAWATVLSHFVSAAMLLIFLSRDDGPCRFSPKLLKIRWPIAGEILRVGIPAGIQACLINVSNMAIARSIIRVNNLMYPGGSAVLDGHSAAVSVAHFVTSCCGAFEATLVSFTSQNLGAKNYDRMKRIFRRGYLSGFLFTIAACGVVLLAQNPLLSLYLNDPDAIAIAHIRMWLVVGTFPICVLMDCSASYLRGMGRSATSTTITLLATCFLRIVWVHTIFERYQTLESVYLSYPVSYLLGATAQFIAVWLCFRKIAQKDPSLPVQT